MLEGKNAVVYGGGGSVGGAVARAFAREGARVFLAGRTLATLDAVVGEIHSAGGSAETAEVDALDERAIEGHLGGVEEQAGGIDISFNAISIQAVQGTPLLEMSLEDFGSPITTGTSTHFLTARAAGRRMVERGSGTILTLSTSAAGLSGRDRRFHRIGGFGVACEGIEALTKQFAAELGPRGVRVVCLRPDALPETWPDEDGAAVAEIQSYMRDGTMLGRMPTLAEVGDAAAFVASDRAGAMTATVANLTCGSIVD